MQQDSSAVPHGPRSFVFEGESVVSVVAPAKINLFLGVGTPRRDGYHDVTTVMHALELCDDITLAPSAKLSLVCEPQLDVPPQDNLAFRAAEAMGQQFSRVPAFDIVLRKRIPHGAGLGGGSSDAAAIIAALVRLWGIDSADPGIARVAASLGADVPFFLLGSGCALMGDRGDQVERELPAAAAPVVLVRPHRAVPTSAAYAAFDAAPEPSGDPAEVIRALESGDLIALAGAVANNLEAASGAVVPEVAAALGMVRSATGVLGAAVAGSGSACFGICASDEDATRIATEAAAAGYWSAATRLRAAGVTVAEGSE